MPLTAKGEKIKGALEKEYGEKKGEQVLYAGKNKGTFTGIDADGPAGAGSKDLPHLDSDKVMRLMDGVSNLAHRFDAMVKKDAEKKGGDELDRLMKMTPLQLKANLNAGKLKEYAKQAVKKEPAEKK